MTELVYGTLRWRGKIDWIISQFSKIPTKRITPPILNIIRLGVYQLLFLDKIPSFASVNESVTLAGQWGHRGQAAFVNANLRSINRARDRLEYPDLGRDPALHISVVYSHPLWMIKRWLKRFGSDVTIELCKSNNETPPLTIRTNTLKVSRQKLFHELMEEVEEISLCTRSLEGIDIKGVSDIRALPSFLRGWFQVQDEASQLISHILSPMPGQKILDACAAPGGKTTHLAQLMENSGDIYALDSNISRLKLLEESCKRLGITNVNVFKGDASYPLEFREKFHGILVDAPCSGLGTLRRNPDSKWKKKKEDIVFLSRLQLSILNNLADYVKESGVLVYSTCTLAPEENEEIIESFLQTNPAFRLADISELLPPPYVDMIDDRGFFHSFPHLHHMDGFFAARLIKHSTKR